MAKSTKSKASKKSKETAEETSGNVVLGRGVKLISETVAPGASLMLDGNVAQGAAHLVGGIVARSVLGPVGWFLVAANSYSKSVSDKNLIEHFTD